MAVSLDANASIAAARDQVIADATSLAKAGFFGRSLALVDGALREEPRDPYLLYARALSLLDWGRLNEALAGLRAAKDAGFASFGLFVNLAQVCHASGLADEAEYHALQAIALDDRHAAGHLCLAVLRQAAKRYAEAIELYERGYALAPERVDALWEIASCLLDQNSATRAEAVARRAIAVHGNDHVKSWALLATALAMQSRWDEAMALFERAEALEPRNGGRGDTFQLHGFQLLWSGRIDDALGLYRQYLPASANNIAHAQCGLVLLTAGHLREGWPLYEFRWTFDRLLAIRPRLGRPEWRGQDLTGRRLLLWAEQGVGDIVQFVRVARLFKDKGAYVLLHVPERLRDFARDFDDVDRVVCDPAEFIDGFDYHLSLMSASGALQIDLESIPANVPYLTIDPDQKRRWRERLAFPGHLKVGLAWAGNPNHEHDRFRSIPLARLASLFDVEGVRFFSLQKEVRAEDAGALAASAGLIDLAPELHDFRDTAAAIDALDLVVAVDTAVVHVAGALAKPAWVMLQTPPDFRWMLEGDANPWYPSLRLFRQPRPGEWVEVIARVREALANAAAAWRSGNTPTTQLAGVPGRHRYVPAVAEPAISPLCGITDTRYGIVQTLGRGDSLARSLEFYGEWLQPQLDVAVTKLDAGGVVVEAGSGIGAHTVELARRVGPTGAVFAYEPDARRFRVLIQNLHLNKVGNQVTALQRSLSGPAGTTVSSADAEAADREGAHVRDAVDELALNRLDLLKISSAGAAGDILDGARDVLWRFRPMLLVSSDDELIGEVAAKIESFGYRCWRMITPWFAATNHNGRPENIFGNRTAVALVGMPEETEPPALLDAYEEVSGPYIAVEHQPREIVGSKRPGANQMARWMSGIGRALSLRWDAGSALARSNGESSFDPASDGGKSGAVAARLDDSGVVARYNSAGTLLLRGDYLRGFELYDNRFDAFEDRAAPARKFETSLGRQRRWRGESLSGRRIVIWCEQGFGDSVMMFRYLPLLKAQGAKKVMVVCERELVGLVQAMPAVDRVFSGNDVIGPDDFDLQCPCLSLPRGFRTTYDTVPRDVPYVTVPKNRVEEWRRRLACLDGRKIGLTWAGGEILEADARRSIQLGAFEPLLRLRDVRFVSLQKDRRLDETPAASQLIDWMSECRDFLETAALIEALDLVISVDTAVAHVAGALGKEVWLLNRLESEWRWGHGLTRSVWYPSMTIFNQRNDGRWEDVIEDLARQLHRAAAGRARDVGLVCASRSKDFEGLFQSGSQSLHLGDVAAAEASFRDATRIREDSAPAWNGLGAALALQDRHAEAREALRRACQFEDDGGEPCDSFVNLANSLASDLQMREAIALYRAHLPKRPSPQGHYNYALALLSVGELIEGWRHYEFRWLVEPLASLRPRYAQPQWAGQDLRGKTLLLHCEQGFGDTIQYVRYAPQLKALGAHVILLVQPELVRLAHGFAGIDGVFEEASGVSFDYYIPLLSLPRIFGADLSSVPANVPYLSVEAERRAHWAQRLATGVGPKVGVVWAGSRAHARDRSRSLPLTTLEPIIGIEAIYFFSLQKPVESGPVESVAVGTRLIDLGPGLHDFADTAAAISQMDLVLCVDTSVAHLAAALGKPVWLMLPQPADARWLEEREDSPWYPTMRLFRQTQRDDWSDVVERVKVALEAWIRHGPPATPLFAKSASNNIADPSLSWTGAVQLNAGHRQGLTAVAHTRVGILQYLPDEPIVGDSIAWYGEHMQPQLDLLAQLVKVGATIVEVGAGVGMHALGLARIAGSGGQVYLYESRPVVQRILRQNLAANDLRNVKVMAGTLAKSEQVQGVLGGASLGATLDELRLERLDCLKIGAREEPLAVLAGANETMWRLRPLLLVAASDERMLSQLAERLREFGYRCWRVGTALFNPLNFNQRDEDIFGGRMALALLAIPEEAEVNSQFEGCIEI
ncbi:MAG: hypothetical protein C5B46_03070 [Proteobacteria bacterium]|nr:MAG: hypothetical protein C5B46_03070 [Pseudomonadota bacterium]